MFRLACASLLHARKLLCPLVIRCTLISVCCLQCKICLPLLGRDPCHKALHIVSELRKEGSEAS